MGKKITSANYRTDRYYPKVRAAVERLLASGTRRAISPIEVFVEMGLLDPENVRRWWRGEGSSLERVIQCNLAKASRILRILRLHAHDLNLRPSLTVYKHKGRLLRFSKHGERALEEAYARHFVVTGSLEGERAKAPDDGAGEAS